MDISKSDYDVLITLYKHQFTKELKACTIEELNEMTNLSVSKLRESVKLFKALGYIMEGAVNHRSKTYFISPEGIMKLYSLGGVQ